MENVGVITSPTPSLSVVGKDLVYAFRNKGHPAEFYDYRVLWFDAKDKFSRAIVVMTFDPLYAPTWFLMARDYNVNKIPSIVYTTVEGQPKPWLIRYWIKRDIPFVANSKFTEKMLRLVDIDPIGMIPHGVNFSEIQKAKMLIGEFRRRLKERLETGIIFGTIVSGHKRKGLDYLAKAIKTFREKNKDVGFYVLTGREGAQKLAGINGVVAEARFGKWLREEVLALIGSFDFYVQPSFCEGFCLPLLEAMALGIPSIYANYEPLTEFFPPNLNFTVKVVGEEEVDLGDGILYLCHYYEPNEMAEKFEEAYELYTCNKRGYVERRKELMQQATKFDCTKTYKEFLKVWG